MKTIRLLFVCSFWFDSEIDKRNIQFESSDWLRADIHERSHVCIISESLPFIAYLQNLLNFILYKYLQSAFPIHFFLKWLTNEHSTTWISNESIPTLYNFISACDHEKKPNNNQELEQYMKMSRGKQWNEIESSHHLFHEISSSILFRAFNSKSFRYVPIGRDLFYVNARNYIFVALK